MSTLPFSSTFIPCTAPSSACAQAAPLFFGVAGTCNVTTSICQCPPGYGGVDVMLSYNDCHINLAFRDTCYIIVLIMTAIGIVASCAGTIKLSVMWGVLFWKQESDDKDGMNGTFRLEEKSEMRTRDVSVVSRSPKPLAHISLQAPSMSSTAHTSATMTAPIKTLQHYASQQQQEQAMVTSPGRSHSKSAFANSSTTQQQHQHPSPVLTRAHSKSASAEPSSPARPGSKEGTSISREGRPSGVLASSPRRSTSKEGRPSGVLSSSPVRSTSKEGRPPSPVRSIFREGRPSGANAVSPRGAGKGSKHQAIPLEEQASQAIRRDSSEYMNNSDDEEPRTNMSKSHYYNTGTPKRKKSRAPRLSLKPMQQPKTNVRSPTFFQDITLAKRRRNTCLILSNFTAYSCYSFITLILLYNSFTLEIHSGIFLWAFWWSFTCLQWALWLMAYSWCATLPSMRSYSKMFPTFASHPLIRFPRLPQVVIAISLSLSAIFPFVFFFILPMNVSSEELRDWVIPVGLTLNAVLLLLLLVFQTTVFSLLLKMFGTYNHSQRAGSLMDQQQTSTLRNETTPAKGFDKARRLVLVLLIIAWTAGPIVIISLLLAAWGPTARQNMYFFLSALFGLGSILAIGSTYVSVYRIASTSTTTMNTAGPDGVGRARMNGSMALRSQNHHNEVMSTSARAGVPPTAGNALRVSDGTSLDEDRMGTPKTSPPKSQSNRSVSMAMKQYEVTSNESSEVQLG